MMPGRQTRVRQARTPDSTKLARACLSFLVSRITIENRPRAGTKRQGGRDLPPSPLRTPGSREQFRVQGVQRRHVYNPVYVRVRVAWPRGRARVAKDKEGGVRWTGVRTDQRFWSVFSSSLWSDVLDGGKEAGQTNGRMDRQTEIRAHLGSSFGYEGCVTR